MRGLDSHAGVEEVPLVAHQADRLGLIHRRGGHHPYAMRRQRPDRPLQLLAAVYDIRPEPQIAEAVHSPSRHTSTETSDTGRAIGGSGFAALIQTACAS